MATAMGWPEPQASVRPHEGGASLALSAPEDQLLTATEVNEWAWLSALGASLFFAPGHPLSGDGAQALPTLRRLAAAEYDLRFMALLKAAEARELPALFDDEELTLGGGEGSRSWPLAALPEPEEVPWGELHAIPAALVTGSNGKTTSVRLVAAMLEAQGLRTGHSCTDGVFISGVQVARGDYSGPAGSRRVLREPGVQAAVLETARGGILRRGIALRRADAALVTNVSPDHFGEYGVDSLEDLADVKLVVARALGERGLLVLNAEDPTLRRKAEGLRCPLAWFGLDDEDPFLIEHRLAGGPTCGISEGRLRLHWRGERHELGLVEELPLAMGGHAAYNLANMAGAALLAAALGVAPARIAELLARFGASRADNPGRLERWNLGGLQLLMDYAHNPEGLAGLLAVARGLGGRRLGLLLGQAGNREDEAIRDLAHSAAEAHPDFVVLKDLDGYLRGRERGEVPALLEGALLDSGLPPERILTVLPEVEAVGALLAWARPGDVLVLPVHGTASRERVGRWLDGLAASAWLPGQALPAPPE